MQDFIEIIKYILIGIIQGLTEILPLSSSGHLAILYKLLNINIENQLGITIYLHFASSLSLLMFFKRDILNIANGSIKYIFKKDKNYIKDFKIIIYLIIASIPAAIVGLFFDDYIEMTFNNIYVVAFNFIITAIILFIHNTIYIKQQVEYNFKNTFITGIFQAFAIMPGISRSGMTLFGSKITSLKDDLAKKFSFYLLIIVSFGSSFISLIKTKIYFNETTILYLISMLFAFIFTYLALKILFKCKFKKAKYFFSFYLLIISFLVFLLF